MDERGKKSLVPIDALVLNALTDARSMGIRRESAGIVLASCATKLDQHHVRLIGKDTTIDNEISSSGSIGLELRLHMPMDANEKNIGWGTIREVVL